MLRVTCVLVFVAHVLCLEFDYYDLPDLTDAIDVACGNETHKIMGITYGGEAHSIYAVESPDDTDCHLTEVGPARWYIIDALADCSAAIVVSTDPQLRSIEVVVQMQSVRTINDEAYIITCNYELGGSEISYSADTSEGDNVKKIPSWHLTDDKTADSVVELRVYDAENLETAESELGDYIQLRAVMNTTGTTEVSLRMWNCRAYTPTKSYYFLQSGCGEMHVIHEERGFHTRTEADFTALGWDRVSRSAYFRTFMFPGATSLTFECDYVVCETDACDGYSCENNADFGSRRKRSLEENTALTTGKLPTVTSQPLHILFDESKAHIIDASELISSLDELEAMTSLKADENDSDLLTIGLISGLSVLGLVLLVTACVALVLWRRVALTTAESCSSMHARLAANEYAVPYGKRPVC